MNIVYLVFSNQLVFCKWFILEFIYFFVSRNEMCDTRRLRLSVLTHLDSRCSIVLMKVLKVTFSKSEQNVNCYNCLHIFESIYWLFYIGIWNQMNQRLPQKLIKVRCFQIFNLGHIISDKRERKQHRIAIYLVYFKTTIH